jgi:GNAT superfamily N-acetyltransferase
MISILPVDIASDDAQALIAELDGYLHSLYSEEDNFFELAHSEVRGDRGVFLVAYLEDAPAGCGAVRRRSATTGEIKRMYVVGSARNKGVGALLLGRLEDWARRAGLSRLVLETGKLQTDAMRLYSGAGYEAVQPFEEYGRSPVSCCYTKQLRAPARD